MRNSCRRFQARVTSLLLALLTAAGLATLPAAEPANPFHAVADSPAQPPAAAHATVLPIEGSLPNGLRYTLLPHCRVLGRVSVRLVVHAGSLDERDDERGYAHFVEHMAFNGTRHFPPGKLREFFQSLGLAEGADLNATTSFTATTYKLDLPAGRTAQLGEALQVLRDFADGIDFSAAEVERERGVVLSELAARDTDDAQVTRQRIAALYAGTLIPARLPVGNPADLGRATAGSLRAFYRRCYAPGRMSLVVVGDIEPEAAKKLLAETFSSLQADRTAVAQVLPSMPAAAGTLQTHVLTSANALAAHAELVAVERTTQATSADLRAYFARQAAVGALSRRLHDRRTRESRRVGLARASRAEGADRRFMHAGAEASAATDDWVGAVALIETELRRALVQGFAPAEVQEQTATRLAWARAAIDTMAGESPDTIATEIAAAIGGGQNWHHPASVAATAGDFATAITADEVATALRTMFAEERLHLLLTRRAPPAGGTDAVLAAWRASAARPLDPAPPPPAPFEFRYADAHRPGAIASRRTEADLGIELVAFANGARLNLRRSPTEPGRFRLAARLGRGLVDFPRDRPGLPHIAAHLLRESDLHRHTRDEVNRLVRLRALAAHATFDHRYLVEISGPVAELPFALQVLAAEFSDANVDPARFAQALSDTAGCRAAQLDDGPDHAREGIIALMAGGDPRLREPPPSSVGNYTFAEVTAWLRAHWLEGPLEIALAGDFELTAAIAAAAQSVGALAPLRDPAPGAVGRPVLRTQPAHEIQREPLADATAAVRLAWPAGTGSAPGGRHALELATDVLVDRLHQSLRQELGATYTPEGGVLALPQHHAFAFASVALTFDPGRAAELARRALALADEFARDGVRPDEFARLREPLRAAAAENLRSNEWWLDEILAHAQSDPAVLSDVRALPGAFDRLTREEVDRAAAEHFRSDRASSLVVLPVAPTPAAEENEPSTAAEFVDRGGVRSNRGDFDAALGDFARALDLDPKNEDAYLNRGVARLQCGDPDGAIADCTRALELNPRNAVAYSNRAGAKLRLGALDGAIADCTKAIELDPTLALAFANRAGARLGRGDMAGCVADCSRALELDPGNATAYVNRGAAYGNQGDRARALADLTKAIELDPRNTDAYNNRGYLRQLNGYLDGAFADFDRALELNPSALDARRNRGQIHQIKGRAAAALADFDKVLELSPDDEAIRLNRGLLRQQKGDLDGALADIDHIIRLNAKNPDAYNNRGYVKQLRRDLDGAIADYTKAIELRPDFAVAFNNRGQAKRLKGDTFGAMDDLDKGIRLSAPTRPASATPAPPAGTAATRPKPAAPSAEVAALVRTADAKRARRDYPAAIADYTAALKLAPDHAAAYLGRGYAHDARNDYRASFVDFDRVIQLDPRSAQAFNGRGYARNARGDYDGAMADFNRTIELSPRFAAPFNNRAITRRIKGDLSGSLADLDAALKLAPSYTTAYNQRAITKQVLGDYAGAVADYDRYLAKTPTTTYPHLHRFLCLPPAERAAALPALAATIAGWADGWPKSLGRYLAGDISADALLAQARKATGRLGDNHSCEAHYAIGMTELATARTAEARAHFEQSTAKSLQSLTAFHFARAELSRLDSPAAIP